MLTLIQVLHILVGTIWLVGILILACAFYPILARKPAEQAKRSFDKVGTVAASRIGAAGGLTLLVGPLRAYLGGRITSFADFAQPYALLVITAFVLVLAATMLHGRFRRKFAALTADPAGFSAQARSTALTHAVIEVVLMLAILGIMGALGSGHY